MDQAKYRIATVGEIGVSAGVVYVNNWMFNSYLDWAPLGTFASAPMGNAVCGWTFAELHAIAHGDPCPCGVTQCLTA